MRNMKLTQEKGAFTKSKKKKWLLASITLVVIIGMIALIGYSYAYLYTTLRGDKSYSLKVKGFRLKLDDSKTSGNISLQNITPVSDSVGKTTNAYTFAVINEDASQTGYVIYLDDVAIDDEINRMRDTIVKYQLIENGVEHIGFVSELGTNPFRILTSGIINGNTTNNYSLRFWIEEGSDVPTGQSFSVKIRVVATSPDAINEGKLIFGETIVTSDSGVTQMPSDQLHTYVDQSLGTKIDQVKQETLDKAHPVGSVYITETKTNPSELFGGTWERYSVGKVLVGTDTTSNQTGGSATTTITTENLPSHSHTIDHTHTTAAATIGSSGAHTHTTTQTKTYTMSLTAGTSGSNHTHSTTATTLTNPIRISGTTIRWRSSGMSGSNEGVFGGGFHPSGTQNVNVTIPALSIASSGAHSHTVTGNVTIPALSIASSGAHTHTVPSLSTNSISTKNSGATGGGKAISVQDPYITVYMWKRVS